MENRNNYSEFDYKKAKAILKRLASVVNSLPDYRLNISTFEDEVHSECIHIKLNEKMHLVGNILDGVNCINLLVADFFIKEIKPFNFIMDISQSQIFDTLLLENIYESRKEMNSIFEADNLEELSDKQSESWVEILDHFIHMIELIIEKKFTITT